MPRKINRPCSKQGCPNLITKRGRCDDHQRPFTSPNHHKHRHMYDSKAWKTLRHQHLREQPYCSVCESPHRLEVDHIVPHDGDYHMFFNPNNLDTKCKVHHSQKTRQEEWEKKKG